VSPRYDVGLLQLVGGTIEALFVYDTGRFGVMVLESANPPGISVDGLLWLCGRESLGPVLSVIGKKTYSRHTAQAKVADTTELSALGSL